MLKNTSFYISDPSIIGSRLFDDISSINSYEGFSEEDNASGFKLYTDWGNITLNIMPSEQIESHLNGFDGYIRNQTKNEEDVHQFLFEFNSALNGLMFLHDSVWDWTCEALCGPHKNS